jgi:Tol biopolymer transport system component
LLTAVTIIVIAFVILLGYRSRTSKPVAAPHAVSFQNMSVARLTHTGTATVAAISPDGKYVVHAMAEGKEQSLYVLQVSTGSNVQVLPPADAIYLGLAFSPDGNYVYFTRNDTKNAFLGSLYQMPVLGGAPTRLITDVDTAVTFSPDGKHIAFGRGRPDLGEENLIVATADGSFAQKLASLKISVGPVAFPVPAWSPDGKVIAMGEVSGMGHSRVVLIDVGTGQSRTLAEIEDPIGQLAWVADGTELLMGALDQSKGSRGQIFSVSYPGGTVQKVSNDLSDYSISNVSVTANSTSLITTQADELTDIWVLPGGDSKRAKQITTGLAPVRLGWTPDSRIVYSTRGGEMGIVDADGRNPRVLARDAGVFFSVCGDGAHIVFRIRY